MCACVSVSADGMGDPGQGPSFASGCRTSAPPPLPTSPHLPPSCCPRGRPRGEATSIYSPSVPPPASSFLPARLPPAPSRLSVLDPRGLAPRVGVGVGQAQTATGYRLKTPHCVQGCEVDPGQKDRMRAGQPQLAEACLCLLRALAAPCLGLQEGMRNGTLGECGLQSSPAFGHCGHCGTWPPGFPRVFSATAHLSLPVPSSWLGDCPHR